MIGDPFENAMAAFAEHGRLIRAETLLRGLLAEALAALERGDGMRDVDAPDPLIERIRAAVA